MPKFIITEKCGNGRARVSGAPTFKSKAEADQYISECPNAFAWRWGVKKLA